MSTEIKLPSLGENVESVDVARVLVEVGQTIAIDDPLLELETDKAAIELPAEIAGVVEKIHVEAGSAAKVGAVLLTVKETGGAAAASPPAAKAVPAAAAAPPKQQAAPVDVPLTAPPPPPPVAREAVNGVPAAPSVRRFAREIGIDIGSVPGSGPAGRVSLEDVKVYSRSLHAALPTALPATTEERALPDFDKWGETHSQPMSNVRAATAVHLSYAWRTIPHVTQFDRADITELDQQRRQLSSRAEAAGGKLTVTAIILKIVAAALKRFPQFNASVDIAGKSIIYKDYCHIGVAVDTDRGLLVPVIRDVNQKNLIEISVELNELAARARSRKTGLEEMQGGCFTVTNLGGIGGTNFTPIVNWPEVAILGVARGSTEPVWQDGAFVPRLMCPLALSYDHRVIDGADGARFLRWIAEALENPMLVILEG